MPTCVFKSVACVFFILSQPLSVNHLLTGYAFRFTI